MGASGRPSVAIAASGAVRVSQLITSERCLLCRQKHTRAKEFSANWT